MSFTSSEQASNELVFPPFHLLLKAPTSPLQYATVLRRVSVTHALRAQAGMLAAIPAAWVTTKKGRKISMLVASSCYIVGIIIVTAAVHIAMLIIGRILLGIGVGFAIQVGFRSGAGYCFCDAGCRIMFLRRCRGQDHGLAMPLTTPPSHHRPHRACCPQLSRHAGQRPRRSGSDLSLLRRQAP